MSTETKRFVRHYVEMVVVMFAGMGILAMPAEWVLNAFGSGWSEIADDGMLLVMAATMVLPMVAWMALRGHTPRANAEMALAMIVPALAAAAFVWFELGVDIGPLMVAEHVAMLAAMLLRADEYRHHRHHRAVAA